MTFITHRTHQIRVHLKERRTPIAGDEAYGTAEWNKKLARSDNIHRPLLHAYETEFTHPFTGTTVLCNISWKAHCLEMNRIGLTL